MRKLNRSMMKLELVTLLVAVVVDRSYAEISEDRLETEWLQFKEKFKPKYKTIEEEQLRREIFAENLKKIEKHNEEYRQGLWLWYMGVNQFTDKTDEERSKKRCRLLLNLTNEEQNVEWNDDEFEKDLPENFNWVDKGIVTPVKDQGNCASCYAFAATGLVESANALATGKLISLSEQQVVSCSKGNYGCHGGFETNSLNYIKHAGQDTEESYPYEQFDTDMVGPCRDKEPGKKIGARLHYYKRLWPNKNETALLQALMKYGPLSVAVQGNSLEGYTGGILEKCFGKLNHAVLLVGYGVNEDGVKYWIVKNSWSEIWGEDGYFRVKRGECGIEEQAYFAVALK